MKEKEEEEEMEIGIEEQLNKWSANICIGLVGKVWVEMDKDRDKQLELWSIGTVIKNMGEQFTRDLDTV